MLPAYSMTNLYIFGLLLLQTILSQSFKIYNTIQTYRDYLFYQSYSWSWAGSNSFQRLQELFKFVRVTHYHTIQPTIFSHFKCIQQLPVVEIQTT